MSAVTEVWAASFEQELSRLGTTAPIAIATAGGPAWDERGTFLASLPPGYAEETAPEDAAVDWLEMSSLLRGGPTAGEWRVGTASGPAGGLTGSPTGTSGPDYAGGLLTPSARRTTGHASRLVLCPCRPGAPGDFRLRRVGLARVELSSFLPVLESFGLAVVEAVPWHFQFGAGQPDAYVDDIGLRVDTPLMEPGMFDPLRDGPRLVDALDAVLSGRGSSARSTASSSEPVSIGARWPCSARTAPTAGSLVGLGRRRLPTP